MENTEQKDIELTNESSDVVPFTGEANSENTTGVPPVSEQVLTESLPETETVAEDNISSVERINEIPEVEVEVEDEVEDEVEVEVEDEVEDEDEVEVEVEDEVEVEVEVEDEDEVEVEVEVEVEDGVSASNENFVAFTPPVNEPSLFTEPERPVTINTALEKETIGEKYQGTKGRTINDMMAEIKKDRDLATQLQNKPVNDLKTVISINDKIRFIKELFNGQSEKYAIAINTLNVCKDLDEAMQYLNDNFTWDESKESFRSFLELVYRRHMPGITD
ncbi:MAG: hypothetical protein ABIJ16_04780 [Bacteroidota bacterium]